MPKYIIYNTETNEVVREVLNDSQRRILQDNCAILKKSTEEKPSFNESSQYLEKTVSVDLNSNIYIEGWRVIAKPQWPNFNLYLLSEPNFISYGLAAMSINPYLVPGITERYGKVEEKGVNGSGFDVYWNLFCNALNVNQAHKDLWAAEAQTYNLPTDFISTIRGQN